MLDQLVQLQNNRIFQWLLAELEKQAQAEMLRVMTVPNDIESLIAREQMLGAVNGLRFLSKQVNEHITNLTITVRQNET